MYVLIHACIYFIHLNEVSKDKGNNRKRMTLDDTLTFSKKRLHQGRPPGETESSDQQAGY